MSSGGAFRFSFCQAFDILSGEDSYGGLRDELHPLRRVLAPSVLLPCSYFRKRYFPHCPAVGLLDISTIAYAEEENNRLPRPERRGLRSQDGQRVPE
jgi:hypothetical protein